MAKVWVVAADAAKARLFESEQRSAKDMHELETWVNPELRQPAHDLTSDRPGRSFDSGGEGRHALAESSDVKEVESERFARELVKWLEHSYHEQRFNHLVIAAAPHFLGLLRQNMSKSLHQVISCEISKDICHLTKPEQIRQHLPDFLY
ncbi:host attachment protein [Halorhodospira halochloris]|uniref:host attachment protein n=1 Tax=Halorhodospira halochloris TaxID=1052 RepID=UPI001EE93C51|nr:host attachment protein [Halorhodospira halochloris]MCG5548663.1 host attachment protein [Halorhodospira halochloris]